MVWRPVASHGDARELVAIASSADGEVSVPMMTTDNESISVR